jgi:hypothetical protein
MRLNPRLENWQNCSNVSDTSRDLHSYLMFTASFNSIASTRLTEKRQEYIGGCRKVRIKGIYTFPRIGKCYESDN